MTQDTRDPNASFTLTPAALDALKRGSPIEAIKLIREATGVGLAEAKGIVEEIARSIPAEARFKAGMPSAPESSHHARAGLGPGEVARGGGPGKWLVLIAVAALVVLGALFY